MKNLKLKLKFIFTAKMSLVHTNKVNTTNNEVKAFKSNYVMVENDKYIFIDKEIIQVLEMARKRIEDGY